MKYIGIDIAKQSLQASNSLGNGKKHFDNSQEGIAGLLHWLGDRPGLAQCHLIIEPTNTYHHSLVQALAGAQVNYTLINPAQTAAFARVQGKRAKTDPVDGQVLASFGESQQPEASPPPWDAQEKLKALERHQEWLERELRATRNRLDSAQFSPWTPQPVLDSLERTIDQLTQEIEATREAINQQLELHHHWSEQLELLTSIPGIGRRTASLLLSEMPPVTQCGSAKSWVAYCGLAPEPRQSGKGSYSRLSRVGTPRVRAGLYMPAISALRWNPAVRDLGQRLKEREKKGRVRIVAAMHKLLRICYGVLKSGLPFDPQRCQPATLDI